MGCGICFTRCLSSSWTGVESAFLERSLFTSYASPTLREGGRDYVVATEGQI